MKEGKMSRSQPQRILTENKKMLAMAKLQRPELSNQNPQVFNKLNRLPVKGVGKTISTGTRQARGDSRGKCPA